jgi:hypothetical protein
MVATLASLLLVSAQNRSSSLPFPSSANYLRTVLAVKGSLRRAYRRALDGSGPF